MSCNKCAVLNESGDPANLFGLASVQCFCGTNPILGLQGSGWPGDMMRLEKESAMAVGWFPFSNAVQINAANLAVVDFKLSAQCFSAEMIDSLAFTGNNPTIGILFDRVRVLVYPGAVAIDPALFSAIRRSLFISITSPIGAYSQGLYNNIGYGFDFSTGSISAGSGTVADVTRDTNNAHVIDDRVKPGIFELFPAGDSVDQIISRQNVATAGTYRFDVLLHGVAFGGLNTSIREKMGECTPTKEEAIRRWIRHLALDAQGIEGGGHDFPASRSS